MIDDRLPPVTLVATYPPRQCGIATYTRDLRDALARLATSEADAPAVVALLLIHPDLPTLGGRDPYTPAILTLRAGARGPWMRPALQPVPGCREASGAS